MEMIELRGYIDGNGVQTVRALVRSARRTSRTAKVAIALTRLEQGSFSRKGRCRRFGVQDRLWARLPYLFGRDGETLVILLGGGTTKRQNQDIRAAQQCRADYKRRKEQESH